MSCRDRRASPTIPGTWHLALPLTCLTIGSFATLTMLTKNTFIEEIRKQYVLVARVKGLPERKVLYKHVFRNAMLPIVTGLPAALVAAFFGGALLIETLFSLDGWGCCRTSRSCGATIRSCSPRSICSR